MKYQLNPLLLEVSYARAGWSYSESDNNETPASFDYDNKSNPIVGSYNKNHKYYGTFKGKHNIFAIRHDPQGRMILIRWWKTPSRSKNLKDRDKPNQFLVQYLGRKRILDQNQLDVFMKKINAQHWNDGFIDDNSDIERYNMRRYLPLYQKYGGGKFQY